MEKSLLASGSWPKRSFHRTTELRKMEGVPIRAGRVELEASSQKLVTSPSVAASAQTLKSFPAPRHSPSLPEDSANTGSGNARSGRPRRRAPRLSPHPRRLAQQHQWYRTSVSNGRRRICLSGFSRCRHADRPSWFSLCDAEAGQEFADWKSSSRQSPKDSPSFARHYAAGFGPSAQLYSMRKGEPKRDRTAQVGAQTLHVRIPSWARTDRRRRAPL